MASLLLGAYLLAGLAFARPALAEDAPSSLATGVTKVSTAYCRGLNTAVTPDTCEGLNESAKQVDSQLISPSMQVALLGALMDLITFVFDRLAYEAAIWVGTGGEGETPLFNAKTAEEAWVDFGLDIAGDAIGELNETVMTALNVDFDICAPTNPLFKLSIQLGVKQSYQPQEPKCNFKEVWDNWDSFISTTSQTAADPSQAVLKAFAEGFKPGQNELSATVGLNLSVHQRVLEAKTNSLFEQVNSGGFKSVTDVITGQVKTPSSVLQSQFQNTLKNYDDKPTELHAQVAIQNADLLGNMFLQVAGVFTNTLLSTLMNKIYTGLFDVQPETDLLNGELASVSSAEDVASRFSSLITAAPTQVDNYNVIAEFVACPVGPVAVRNINNCVMDSGFATALSRAESGTPLTVQDAIDEGLISGDWPLIPHEGDGIAKNQDSLCYTYGYCIGNLVKMRKARIIPIGWEIAASRNDASNPSTLQDVIDGYNDCGDQNGGIDTSTHQWCHLIDPNWVIKYPETQCRALVNGELLISTLSAGRAGVCADTPSCISEANDGSCDGGFGYCVEEKNVWRFRGEDCPAQYASCMSFENTDSGDSADLLLNTVDYANCDADNAGCEWYRTNKYYDDAGTVDDTSDDTYEWLAGNDTFVTANREDDTRRLLSSATTYRYETTGAVPQSYDTYSYQDRVYYNNNVEECSEDAAGCTAVYQINDTLVLNLIQNPSFEDDEDLDGMPDRWKDLSDTTSGTLDTSGGAYGDNAFSTDAVSTHVTYQTDISVAPGSFYTLSFYARQDASTGTDTVYGRVSLTDGDDNHLDLSGTSVSSSCAVADWLTGTNNSVLISGEPDSDEYQRYECTFTVPDSGNGAVAHVWFYTGDAWIDAVQLELGETASDYTEGYNSTSPTTSYLLMPPAYLGCSGAATDPADCDNYAQVCTAQDVDCNLYTPGDGDPSIPAIAQELDECPSECVGYAAFKQEATDREVESFPEYFIASTATSCSSDYVGCDTFTNLDTAAAGGESDEYFTDLRACMKVSMTGSDADNTASTFFTWEGSDLSGFQLVTWSLLESDADASDTVNYSESSGVDDSHANLAPCVNWDVSSESELVCIDDTTGDAALEADDECNEHDDILSNPDCREFYDDSGYIHYREVSATVAVSDDCHPYRFAGGEEVDCNASGGYWTDIGDCRYYGLAEESTECPAAQAGCRSYTGGAGRNASTVYSDDIEDGSVSEYYENTGATITVSNESIATDGHSLRVATTTGSSIETVMQFLDGSDTSLTYDDTDATTQAATCSSIDSFHTVTDSGCEIDDGTGNACTVEAGDNNCGTLDDVLVAGKTYLLSFWAKGSGNISVTFDDLGGSTTTSHDFVDPTNENVGNDAITLEGGWHEYTLGPLDTSTFTSFDDSAIISFGAPASSVFYLDNIRLKAVEENVAVIKDSWVTPSTCDQTPDGASSPQYYLGCEEYTDQNGETADLYQFSDLCSEEVVGCEAVYDTQNSDDTFGTIYNARCTYVAGSGYDTTVSTNTACVVSGETACTITAGEDYCLFDFDGSVPTLLPWVAADEIDEDGDGIADGFFYMDLGPEARVVQTDMPAYLVDNGTADCTAENVGCIEVGFPTYDQDKSNVTEFESAYLIDDPDDYSDILCENEALFCEEWSSTQDGNYYFKDPADQTCEYQSGVTLNGTSYSGWFRTDTDEPCYWTDTDESGDFDPDADDSYLISGSSFGAWRNGDDDYSGWGAVCPSSEDLCTEFRDEADTNQGVYPAGTPYYFLDDSTLSEESLTASAQCQGQVSQKEGCALFYDSSDSTLSYNTTASYVASTHADDLFGDEPGSKQDPISCEDGGSDITTPAGEVINLCERRCYYETDEDDEILTPSTQEVYPMSAMFSYFSDPRSFLDASCYNDTDCPDLGTVNGDTVSGSCVTAPDDIDLLASICVDPPCANPYALDDDANRVIKVDRDRECAAWLSCQSSQVSWNSRTSKFETICDQIGLCTRYTRTGDTSFCTQWSTTEPVVLDASEYAGRDTTWTGYDYSGYAIPNQLPVDQYDQVNIAPDDGGYICVEGTDTDDDGSVDTTSSPVIPEIGTNGEFHSCEGTSDVTTCDTGYLCRLPVEDFRLSYVAGSCDLATDGWLGECIVGHCEESGDACSTGSDCSGTEECVVGYCQYVDPSVTDPCTEATEATVCVNATYPICDTGISRCVNELAPNTSTCVDVADCTAYSGAQCTNDATSKVGSCINNSCVTDIAGEPLDQPTDAEDQSCRGYPEVLAPFPNEVVTMWKTPSDTDALSTPSDYNARPYSFHYGFETVNACSPVVDPDTGEVSATGDCDCSYDKIQYGDNGAATRYYPQGSTLSQFAQADGKSAADGVCIGGSLSGIFCTDDIDCSSDGSTYAGGTCALLKRNDTVYGWEGYCLERDTSIQTNGSSSNEDRACLTWLPVDQLSGASDLYGKYLNAGYNGGDTYYCSEVRPAYVVWNNNPGTDTTYYCPENTFGILDAGGSGHYHCIPKFSFIDGDPDRPCSEEEVISMRTGSRSSAYGATMHEVSASDYTAYLTGDDDHRYCQTFAMFNTSDVLEYMGYDYAARMGESVVDHVLSVTSTLVCTGVSKVASSVLSESNKAWTDRLYSSSGYVIQGSGSSYDTLFAYTAGDAQTPFGVASDRDSSTPISTSVTSNYKYPLDVGFCVASDESQTTSGAVACYDSADAVGNETTQEALSYAYGGMEDYQESSTDPPAWSSSVSCDSLGTLIGSDSVLYDDPDSSDYRNTYYSLYSGEGCNCEEWIDPASRGSGCATQAYCDTSDYTCVGGVNEGLRCEADENCRPLYCRMVTSSYESGGISGNTITTSCTALGIFVSSSDVHEDWNSASERIQEIFAESLALYGFTVNPEVSPSNTFTGYGTGSYDVGAYEELGTGFNTEPPKWSTVTATGDGNGGYDTNGNANTGVPTVPIIASLGECDGTQCEEGEEGRFTVNGVDSGNIVGADGYKHVNVSFFAYANPNQMPIKNIVVDWGQGRQEDPAHDWPMGGAYDNALSGSTSDDNFYQNHRGYDALGNAMCDGLNWGTSSDACDQSYITFTNDYVCETGVLDDLPECETTTDPDGNTRLTNSPCAGNGTIGSAGACVFQPRISVKDNWGWCTGYCDANDAHDETTGDTAGMCYGLECNTSHCPSTADRSCLDFSLEENNIDNPWINYDGYVVVTP